MNKVKCKQLTIKLIFFFLGVWIIQTGVALFIGADIGSDPFTVFTLGLAKIFNITPGLGNMIITFTFLVIIFIFSRKSINIGTVLAMISAGPFIDLMNNAFKVIPFAEFNYLTKVLVLILSCVIIAIGFSMLKATDLGVAPNDLIPFIIAEFSKKEYRWVRVCMDITLFVIGYFLGGINKDAGISAFGGTVIAALLTGPFIQFFMPKLEKFVHKCIYIGEDCSSDSIAE